MIIYRCTTVLINTVQKKLPAQVMLFCPLEVKILYVATHIILVRSGKSFPFWGNSARTNCHMQYDCLNSIAVDASSISFQYYTNGIYYDTDCSKTSLNHAMLVVGYGTDSSTGIDYWILKNRCTQLYTFSPSDIHTVQF